MLLHQVQFEPMLEKAMQRELYRLLLHWFKSEPNQSLPQDKLEARALVVSWGIFGSTLQWSRDAQVRSLESMVEDVIEVVTVNLSAFWDQSDLGSIL
ncbi:hypothetical protein [Paenibacillus periandrae]|uniref:hypothetical protein n=1 Tax=Paenibacillus periandrae TaxID=1761741 RepID=UPI001F09DAFE|nr:hypothetical protein [Paenibacillus periandrae]